jgi:DNA-binding transcriptional LysR family regulator
MLNLRQIEAFKAVIETGTVSRGAERLSISQPAVSKLLQNLEYSTGLSLFARSPGRIVPTAEAMLLYEEIKRTYRGLESLATFVGDIRALHRSTLRIGVMPALSTGFVQDILSGYVEAYPETQVAIHARSTPKIVDWLLAGNLDVGLSSHPLDNPELEQIQLHENPYVCVFPRNHTLGERSSLKPEDLENERFISFSPESDVRTAIDRIFQAAGVRRRLLLEASMAPTICSLVAHGLGVSLINPAYIGGFRDLIDCRPFAPTIQAAIRILLPRDRPASLVTEAFVTAARSYIAGLGACLGTSS